ncbi:MAG: PAS domain S-box protein [Dongiaceae bacterium]
MKHQGYTPGWVGPQDALGELNRRTAMLDAIGYAATRMVVGADWQAGIQELLNRFGHATGSSRVSLFEIHPGPTGQLAESCRYDWTEPGQPTMSSDPRYQNMPLIDEHGVVDEWTVQRQRGEVVQAKLSDLTGYNRQVFEDTATLSFISVPIMLRTGCWGFLAFDDCHREREWTSVEIDVLQTAASLIAGAIERAQAEERLRLSEERYALAARGAADGLWDWDVVADRAYFSPRLHEILGLGDGALGDRMSMLLGCFATEDADRVSEYLRTRFAGLKRKFRFEVRSREPADNPHWFVARGMIVYDGERPARVVGSMRDITDVKIAESKLRTLTDDAPVLLCMIDPEDRLVFANSRFLEFFGRTLDDIAGGRWDWTKDIHPDDLPEIQRRGSEALSCRVSVEMEHRVRRHDGEYRWVQETEVARFTPEGAFVGFVGALVDITDRKLAETAFRASEARASAILDNALDAIISIDEAGRVVEFNQAASRIFGYTRSEALGKVLGDLIVPPSLREKHKGGLHHYVTTGEGRIFGRLVEVDGQRADGSLVPVELAVAEVQLPQGRLFTGILRDVSERRRFQAELSDIERRRAVLARHFSPNMVDELMRTGGQLDAVRTQPITVMFADLFNFTALSAAMPMTDVVGLLRSFHALVEEAVFGNEGTLDKYIGDGVMATFGTPRPGPRDATNAVAGARAIVQGINRWNREREATRRRPIRIGVGLHYGEATLGNVGSARRFEHTVVGETVNLASRIEALTRVLDIALLVSEAVVEAVRREGGDQILAGFKDMGIHAIRGHKRPVNLWGLAATSLGAD